MHITSLQNERVKYLVKLRGDKRQRQRDGLMLVEGWDEINLALSTGHIPRTLIACPELTSRPVSAAVADTLTVTSPVFEKISYRENPDGWMAVFPTPEYSLQSLHLADRPLVV